MIFPSTDDVAVRLGRELTAEEVAQAEALIRDAERFIRRRYRNLDTLIEDGKIDGEAVVQVISSAVRRVLLNPEGKTRENIDDYGYGRAEAMSTGDIVITDAEWALIAPVGSASDAFSIRVAGDTPCP